MIGVSQLIPLLDKGYEGKCYELGIIQRQRAIRSAGDLMMLSLYHLVNGCTLIEISEVGRLLRIGEFSDVAFMKRFRKCAEWFQWVSEQLIGREVMRYEKPQFLEKYRVLAFDASEVIEKGRSGRTYRLHYSIDIFRMSGVSYKITGQEVGETLVNFPLQNGDLAIGDRAYGTAKGINHCIQSGADYILRLRTNCLPIYNEDGEKIKIISQLCGLDYEESKEFQGFVRNNDGTTIPVRICAKRKSKEDCEATGKKLHRRASKKQMLLSKETEQFNEYIVVVTSLPTTVAAADILETYRYRWQIECYFKRLKSIMNFGDLPKKSDDSSRSWLNGKIMVALLIETLLSSGSFSPEYALKS